MKIIYNLKLKTFALMALAMVFVACNDDDVPGMEPSNQKPIATTTVTSITIAEGTSDVIPFVMDRATTKPAYFKIQAVGGSATEDEDWTAGTGPLRPDTGNVGDGFEMRIDAGVTSFDIPISVALDLDQTEGDETISLQISAAANRTVLTGPAVVNVQVNIVDFEFCIWTLEMTDDYGDGWNGGYISVAADGSPTANYFNEDLDGQVGVPETQIIEVGIASGVPFSIDYVSGGGTGAGPGWESENTYVITAPDGTVYADGPIPTEGNITSGPDACN